MPAKAAPLGLRAALDRLRAAGIPLAETRIVDDPAEVSREAAALGAFPVVVKAGGLLHKSEHGGVVTGVADAAEAVDAARRLLDTLGEDCLPLLVQAQHRGSELLVGVRRDPGVGAAVVVGLGGIHAEVLDDIAVGLAPLTADDALELLRSLRGWPLLAGHRGGRAVDLVAACQVLVTVSTLAETAPDIHELDLNPVLVGPAGRGAVVVDARVVVGPPHEAPRVSRGGLDRVLRPRHLAVVGVSADPTKAGARLFSYLRRHGFPGRMDAVHPAGGAVDGPARTFRSLDEIDGSPDLVCVAVPAAAVLDVAKAAVRKKAGGLLVHSSGFADGGAEGAASERELVGILAAGGVRLLGPNSMGIVSPPQRLAASIGGVLERAALPKGRIGLVTSSGALGGCLASRLWESGAGISHWISVGNQADVDLAEYLGWLADDEDTTSVGLIVERLVDGPRLLEAGRRLAQRGIAVFACTVGRTPGGVAAAQTHTGALLGWSRLRDAVLTEAGVVVLDDLRTLEDALRQAAGQPLPAGPRLGVVTASGGASALVADAAEEAGLVLPPLPAAVAETVSNLLPDFAGVGNPLDVTAHTINHPERFEDVLRACATTGVFDALLVQFTTNADPSAEATARAVLAVREQAPIPLYVSRYGAADLAPRGLAIYAHAGVHVLTGPEAAVNAIGALVRASDPSRSRRLVRHGHIGEEPPWTSA